jgi:hypothetical protein
MMFNRKYGVKMMVKRITALLGNKMGRTVIPEFNGIGDPVYLNYKGATIC